MLTRGEAAFNVGWERSRRQMLPVFCLGEQFPASVRMKRGTLPTERRHRAQARCGFHSSLPCFPHLIFCFYVGVIMIMRQNKILFSRPRLDTRLLRLAFVSSANAVHLAQCSDWTFVLVEALCSDGPHGSATPLGAHAVLANDTGKEFRRGEKDLFSPGLITQLRLGTRACFTIRGRPQGKRPQSVRHRNSQLP